MHELTCCAGALALAQRRLNGFVQLLLLFSFKDANNNEQEVAFGRYYTPNRQPPARSRDLSIPCLKWERCNIPGMRLCPATTVLPVSQTLFPGKSHDSSIIIGLTTSQTIVLTNASWLSCCAADTGLGLIYPSMSCRFRYFETSCYPVIL